MRYILSILMLTCVTTFLQGCGGEEAPPEETFNEMDQLDPAEEAAAQKKAMQENWVRPHIHTASDCTVLI